jgi:hypothetical protein
MLYRQRRLGPAGTAFVRGSPRLPAIAHQGSSDGLRRRRTGLSRRLAGPSFEGMREGADFLVTE